MWGASLDALKISNCSLRTASGTVIKRCTRCGWTAMCISLIASRPMRTSLESNCGVAAVGRPILLGARLVEIGHLQGAVRSKNFHSVRCPRWAWRGSQKNNCKLHRAFQHTRSTMFFIEVVKHVPKRPLGTYPGLFETNFQLCICSSRWALFI